jgi:hypothetical protein
LSEWNNWKDNAEEMHLQFQFRAAHSLKNRAMEKAGYDKWIAGPLTTLFQDGTQVRAIVPSGLLPEKCFQNSAIRAKV